MKTILATLGVASALALTAGAACAKTYDYTGFEKNPGGPALSCDVSGISNADCNVTFNNAGLGVDGFGKFFPDTGPGQIDNFPKSSESLTLDFGKDKLWHTVSFGHWGHNDDLELSFDGGSRKWGPDVGDTVDLGGAKSSYLTVTASYDKGKGCFFCKPTDGWLGNDGFTVASAKVSAVPLPAAGWMLLAGLGGIAAMKRRKKATA